MLSKSFANEKLMPFPNAAWRSLLESVCRKIDKDDLGLQIISPFGFELLEDKNFLHKSIKRLYCYIGIPCTSILGCHLLKISNAFSKELMSSISEIGIKQSDIAILVVQDTFTLLHANNYQCHYSDKLIDIQAKIINNTILHDYANYIICTIDSIFSKKEEPKHFFENKRHRCRTYQLYIMLEKIFGYLLPPMSFFEKQKFCGLFKRIDNSIQMFYALPELYINASEDEIYVLNTLIIPRVALMQQAIQLGSDALIKLECDAYHIAEKLELAINKNIYENAVTKITTTYLNYIQTK
ncbi:MAG: hypothetical protein A3F42_04260 [Gammaproteobacteria bacterium RIFCSPHIGHO2_12_FULL_37_34]|nr:MAG: hypothetical protein A3F42_04260 [Gammaproteobacteria bacterium RIFCSPHIGHO2_12_FULL_37_34]